MIAGTKGWFRKGDLWEHWKKLHNTVVDSQSLSHTRMHMQKSVFTNLILGSPVHNYFSLSSAQAHCRLSATAVQEPSSISLSCSPQQYPLYLPPQLKANYSPQIRNTISSVILLWTATAKEIKFLLKLIKDKLSVILGRFTHIFLSSFSFVFRNFPFFILPDFQLPIIQCLGMLTAAPVLSWGVWEWKDRTYTCTRAHLHHVLVKNIRLPPAWCHEWDYVASAFGLISPQT